MPTYNNQQGQYNMTKLEIVSNEQMKPQDVDKSHPLDAKNFPHNYYSEGAKKYIIKNTIQNLDYFLKYHDIKARLNEMTYRVEVEMNKRIAYSTKNSDHFVIIKSLLAESIYDKVLNVNDYATQIAISNMYHPVRDWILSKPLTTTGNIKKIVQALKSKNPELSEILFTTWLVGGITAWFHPLGIAAQGNLILFGKGGTRKTSFIKSLLPHGMILEGHVMDVHKDGNKITALSHAITEMGEISASIKKSGNDPLKGFFTKQTDEIRVPYGKDDTIKPRRTIFCGTVNNEKFLTDVTGNRRYWVIDVTDVINTNHGVDIQQLWAEAKELYDNGHKAYLTPEQENIVNECNETYEVENSMEELLLAQYDWGAKRDREINCAEIMRELDLPLFNDRKIREALRKLTKGPYSLIAKRKTKGIVYIMPRLSENTAYRQSIT